MDDLKVKAIEISNKYPFGLFKLSATAANGSDGIDEKVSPCENHLDLEFIKLLDQGAHLDINRMPL